MRLIPFPFRLALLPLCAVLITCGCVAPAHRVRVDAINDPAAIPPLRTYSLFAGSKDLDASTLQFREAASLLRNALSDRGYIEAARAGDAALHISLSYGMGEPETRTVVSSTPVYAELGGGRVQTITNTTDAAGKTTSTTQTHIVPGRYKRVGNDVSTSTYTLYPKHLVISARQAEALNSVSSEVWSVTAAYQSQSQDLRGDLPILITAAAPYLGENTSHAITVKVLERESQLLIEPSR